MLPLLVLSALLACVAASPAKRTLVVHEQIHTVPEGFATMRAAPPSELLNMRIALKQTDMSGLEDELMAVSDPASPRFGQHLSKEEVCTLSNPSFSYSCANMRSNQGRSVRAPEAGDGGCRDRLAGRE